MKKVEMLRKINLMSEKLKNMDDNSEMDNIINDLLILSSKLNGTFYETIENILIDRIAEQNDRIFDEYNNITYYDYIYEIMDADYKDGCFSMWDIDCQKNLSLWQYEQSELYQEAIDNLMEFGTLNYNKPHNLELELITEGLRIKINEACDVLSLDTNNLKKDDLLKISAYFKI